MSTGTYILVAVPVNTGCTTQYEIINNATVALAAPLQFSPDFVVDPTVGTTTLTPDFGTSQPALFTQLTSAVEPSWYLTFAPLAGVPGISVLQYSDSVPFVWEFTNYGTPFVGPDRLVGVYGQVGYRTYLTKQLDGTVIAIIGQAIDVYTAVSNKQLIEPIPVVWVFRSLLAA